MTKAYVTEYARGTLDGRTYIPSGEEPAIKTQVVDYTAGAAATALAFDKNTRFVRIHVDSICSFKFGTAPVAAVTDARMAANATEYFGVPVASNDPSATTEGNKVSFITNT